MCTFLLRLLNKSWSKKQDFFDKYFRICKISFHQMLRIWSNLHSGTRSGHTVLETQICTSTTVHLESVVWIRNVLVRIQIRIPPRLMASSTVSVGCLPLRLRMNSTFVSSCHQRYQSQTESIRLLFHFTSGELHTGGGGGGGVVYDYVWLEYSYDPPEGNLGKLEYIFIKLTPSTVMS